MQTMPTKTLLVATLVVPLLLISCSRSEQDAPLTSGGGEQNQAVPADPGKTLEGAPPAAGMPATPPMEPAPSATEPATPPMEPPKSE